MNSYLKSEKGSALIGLLVVIVIIAALAYGGSFFWQKNTEETKKNANIADVLDEYQQAQDDIGKIEQNIEDYNSIIDNNKAVAADEWDTFSRGEEGFQIDYPHGWYYTVDHETAGDLGYELIIGFAPTDKIWEQEPPYDIELLIMPANLELEEVPGRIIEQVMEKDNKKYSLITFREDYKDIKDIMERMVQSFEFIE
ncbi:hypothetical protein DRH27_04030 [Candidatus Falkowbacteria bacterium]|nr:MAG: hypothetical protein DRH27_04030 [Candidatus Falkowbacteria bacterium]